jgi:hypothetical protein
MDRGTSRRAISRREILRIGGVVLPASIMLPAWMTAKAQTTTTFDFYISTTGSDSNPGTVASPWAITSLQASDPHGNNAKMAGKRVGLVAGTYTIDISKTQSLVAASDNDHCIFSLPPGTAAAPTYLGSSDTSGNYSARAAIFVLTPSGYQQANAFLGVDYMASGDVWVTIDGIVINGNGADTVGAGHGNEGCHLIAFRSGTTNSYTTPGTAQGFVVQNCEVYGINATDTGGNDAAVWFQGTSGAILQNCYIHDVNKTPQVDHAHGHEEYGCQNSQLLYNTFANCTGGAMESKTGCINNVAAYNYVYNCSKGTGGSNTSCIQGWDGGETPDGAASQFQVHHNIFDSCGRVCYGEWFNALHENGFAWYNNTIYNSGAVVLQATGPWVQHYNNLYVLTSGNASGVASFTSGDTNPLAYDCVYDVAGSYSGAFSGQTESGLMTGKDPLLSAGTTTLVSGNGASQFQLASGSPCIGAGHVGGTASGAACNIGAWDGAVTQIGASWTTGAGTPPATPNAAVLKVS